jgi:hypothetical protein
MATADNTFPRSLRQPADPEASFPHIAVFTAAYQFPPPPDTPEHPSSALERFGLLVLAVLLLFTLVLLALPDRWRRRVLQVAFRIGRKK